MQWFFVKYDNGLLLCKIGGQAVATRDLANRSTSLALRKSEAASSIHTISLASPQGSRQTIPSHFSNESSDVDGMLPAL